MKKTLTSVLVAVSLWLPASMAVAHEGHGHENPLSPGHYISNPEHSIQLTLIVSACIAFAWLINRSVRKIKQEE